VIIKEIIMLKGKLLVAQGGGPTAVINESLVGVVNEARKDPGVDRVYGARYGVSGNVNEKFIDLTQETTENLERVPFAPQHESLRAGAFSVLR
jgi:6-phosphofructokinase